MQGYSIGGYLNAVMRRSEKTMLVEGITDKSVLTRLKNDRCSSAGTDLPGVIDVAALLTDDLTKGLGMKDVIKAVLARLAKSPRMLAVASGKFGTLTDREWDGLTLDMELQNPWFAPTQGSPNFVTVGHSVENYFFRLSPIDAFLRQFFSDHLGQRFFNELAARFHLIIGFAVVYSLAMRHIGSIGRADRVISRDMIEWHQGHYISTGRLNAALKARGAHTAQNPYLLINSGVHTYASRYTASEPGHWMCHGHLGEQAIWACVANLAQEQGVPTDVASQIERGLGDVRFRHCVDYLCRDGGQTNAPLDSAIDWLTT
ncbi:hypothetical protein AWB68_05067 [Caballeronia choica]|uniref:DUF4435 domain-containing protein n=1 Tax=Caballeronia choica TaxID=326476 RepID=A0A158K6V5_9BURK|nr:hypothetical protein [Caballeronia choica]SAL76848.1 hypothetical protein AWB68_05067 [Caballeronia choica]